MSIPWLDDALHDRIEVGDDDLGESVVSQHVQEAAQDALAVVLVIVLEVVRAIDRVELPGRQRRELARVAHDVGPAARIDVEQQVLPARVMGRNRNRLARTADVEDAHRRRHRRGASTDGDARELALAGLHDDGAAGGDRERLVGDDVAVHLEPALRDQAQRLRRRVDDPRLLRELRDRQSRRPRSAA